MDGDELVDWTRTRGALKKLMLLFRCFSCHNPLTEPCSFQMCDHYFCKSCALELINNGTNCPACDAVLWREHMQVSLKIPEVMKICERINALICHDSNDQNDGGIENGEAGSCINVLKNQVSEVPLSHLDDDCNTYVFQCPKSAEEKLVERVVEGGDKDRDEVDVIEIDDDSEALNNDVGVHETFSEEISINVTPVSDTGSQQCRITQPDPIELIRGPSQQCRITQPDPIELIRGPSQQCTITQPDPVEIITHTENTEKSSYCEVLDAAQLANTEISFENENITGNLSRNTIGKRFGNTEITFNDVSDAELLPFPLSNESSKESTSLIVDPIKAMDLANNPTSDEQSVFDFCSGTITKTIKFNRIGEEAGKGCDIDFFADRGKSADDDKKGDSSKAMTSIKSRGKRGGLSKKRNNEDTVDMPPTPSPIKSQFSNAISDHDCANGAQRNPSMCAKKPKFTYGNKKKGDIRKDDKDTGIAGKALSEPAAGDGDSVFDFCSGTVAKTIQFGKRDEESSEDEVLKDIALGNGKRKRGELVERTSIGWSDTSEPSCDKENKSKRNVSKPKSVREKHAAQKPTVQKNKTRNLEKKNKKGETALHTACIKGNYDKVKELLELGALPNTKDFNGWTPLHEACNYGHTKIVELLLDYGAIIDCVAGEDNDTPLHDAVSNHRIEVACVLLRRGAPRNIKNKQGQIPEDCALTIEMKNMFNVFETSDVSLDNKFDVSAVSVGDLHVLMTTNLSSSESTEVCDCCKQLGGSLLAEFDSSVTHVICGTTSDKLSKTRTMKYLLAVLTGKWLVTIDWIKDCVAEGKWKAEAEYELSGSVGTTSRGVPAMARVNAFKCLPKLFEGCSFFLSGSFKGRTTKETVMNLITCGGGKILYREPKITDLERSSIVPSTSRGKKTKLEPAMTAVSIPVRVYHARDNSAQVCCTEYIIYDPQLTPGHKKLCSPTLCTAPLPWLFDCISNFEILDVQDAYEQLEGYKSSQE